MKLKFGRLVVIMDDDDHAMLCEFSKENFAIRESSTKGVYYVTLRKTTDEGRREYQVARLIMGLDATDKKKVIFLDRNPLNLTRSNLVAGTHKDTLRGKRKAKGKTSEYLGVHWSEDHKKWRAVIKYGDKNKHLGWFFEEKTAAGVYNEAATKYFGKLARLNIIN